MKKIAKTIAAVSLLASSILANSNTPLYSDNSRRGFVEVQKVLNEEDSETKILGIQPTSEIIGKTKNRYDLKFGLATEDTRVYGYLWNDKGRNNEKGIGIGGESSIYTSSSNSYFYLGGGAGIGQQSVKGEWRSLSTSATKVSFIVGKDQSEPTFMQFESNTFVISISLEAGFRYRFSKNIEIGVSGYTRNDSYQVSYRTVSNSQILNDITFSEGIVGWKTGLTVKF